MRYPLPAFILGFALGLLLGVLANVAFGQQSPPVMDRAQLERQLIQARAQRDMLAERRQQLDEQIILLSGRMQQAEQAEREAKATATAAAAIPMPTADAAPTPAE